MYTATGQAKGEGGEALEGSQLQIAEGMSCWYRVKQSMGCVARVRERRQPESYKSSSTKNKSMAGPGWGDTSRHHPWLAMGGSQSICISCFQSEEGFWIYRHFLALPFQSRGFYQSDASVWAARIRRQRRPQPMGIMYRRRKNQGV